MTRPRPRRRSRLAGLRLRNSNVGPLLDLYLVSAVTTILVVRLQLFLTGYPQLGGGGLHIAHMLWGGLLMGGVIAIVLALISSRVLGLAAVVGGIGFGLFIDELGKFVTEDNDYFYRPTAAIVYVIFMATYLATRSLFRRRELSEHEYLVNAADLVKEAAGRDLYPEEKRRALDFLDRSDPANPLVPSLRDALRSVVARPEPRPGLARRLARAADARYRALRRRRRFPHVLVTIFTLQALASLVAVLQLVFAAGSSLIALDPTAFLETVRAEAGELSLGAELALGSSLVEGGLVAVGVVLLRRSRLAGYRMFDRSLLLSVCVGQVFLFAEEQFVAVVGLGIDLLLHAGVRFLIAEEERGADPGVGVDRLAAAGSEGEPARAGV